MNVKQVAEIFTKLAADPETAELEVRLAQGEDGDELNECGKSDFRVITAFAGVYNEAPSVVAEHGVQIRYGLWESSWGKSNRRPEHDKKVVVVGAYDSEAR